MRDVAPGLVLIDADAARRARTLRLLGLPAAAGRAGFAGSGDGAGAWLVVMRAAGLEAEEIARLRACFGAARIVLHLTVPGQQAAIAAFRAGADDVLAADAPEAELLALARRHMPGLAEPDLAEPGPHEGAATGLVGGSARMRALRARLARLGGAETTVLLRGETGTGKENAALFLHRASPRAAAALVALNCAAIPEALIEGELFGYERGAFSGALAAYPGKLKLADGGTLFLDEIGEFSLPAQAKLLRALEAREFYRLGARVPTRVDVRVIAATNRDLAAEVRAGRFRADLYYRIAVAEVTMPPLRAHAEDIGAIARHLLAGRASGQGGGMRPRAIEDAALARLAAHDWPGNVRELRNVLEAAAATAEGGTIRARDLPAHFDRVVLRGEDLAPPGAGLAARGGRERGTERARLLAALRAAGGNKSLAAAALRCSRMTLYRRLARCGLDGAAEDAPGAPRPG